MVPAEFELPFLHEVNQDLMHNNLLKINNMDFQASAMHTVFM